MAILHLPEEESSPAKELIKTARTRKVKQESFSFYIQGENIGESVYDIDLNLIKSEIKIYILESEDFQTLDWIRKNMNREFSATLVLTNKKQEKHLELSGMWMIDHSLIAENTENNEIYHFLTCRADKIE